MVGIIVAVVLVVVAVLLFTTSIKIVRQANGAVVERLGKYHKTLDVGVHFVLPYLIKFYHQFL